MTFDEMAATGTVDIAASPDAVYALIANVTRIGEFSPECIKAEWSGELKTDDEKAAMAASRVDQLTAAIATTLANLKAAAES